MVTISRKDWKRIVLHLSLVLMVKPSEMQLVGINLRTLLVLLQLPRGLEDGHLSCSYSW